MIEKLLADIHEQLVLLNSKVVAGGAETAAPKATRAKKELPAETTAETTAATTEAPKITREQLGTSLVALAKVSMDAAKAILAKFKAEKLADVAESDYPAVSAAIAEACKPAGADSLL